MTHGRAWAKGRQARERAMNVGAGLHKAAAACVRGGRGKEVVLACWNSARGRKKMEKEFGFFNYIQRRDLNFNLTSDLDLIQINIFEL